MTDHKNETRFWYIFRMTQFFDESWKAKFAIAAGGIAVLTGVVVAARKLRSWSRTLIWMEGVLASSKNYFEAFMRNEIKMMVSFSFQVQT